MNVFDIIICILIAAAVILAVRRLSKNKGGCGCGCPDCPHKNSCNKK